MREASVAIEPAIDDVVGQDRFSAHEDLTLGDWPSEWRVVPLSDVLDFRNGVNADKASYGHGIRFINVLEPITYSHLTASDIPGRVSLEETQVRAFEVRRGDLVFNRTSETQEEIGLAAVYLDDEKVVFGGFVVRGRFRMQLLDPIYSGYALRGPSVRLQLVAKGQGAIRANIGQSDLGQVLLPIPPLPEQRAIAAALSDVDSIIAALNALIAKKRDIKLAAMQQLLAGRTRLPGFEGEWETRRLGDISSIKTGRKNNDDKIEGGKYPFFVRSQNVERIDSYSYDGEAILVPGEGGIGTIVHYIDGRFDFHQRVYKISDFAGGVKSKFIYYTMIQSFGKQATKNSVKATVDSLRLPTFLEFVVELPSSIEEQSAIADILSDMDAEIAALEARVAKTRDIKQGMMQQLLTGRIRLPVPTEEPSI